MGKNVQPVGQISFPSLPRHSDEAFKRTLVRDAMSQEFAQSRRVDHFSFTPLVQMESP